MWVRLRGRPTGNERQFRVPGDRAPVEKVFQGAGTNPPAQFLFAPPGVT